MIRFIHYVLPLLASALVLLIAVLASAQVPATPAVNDYSQSILDWLHSETGFPSLGVPPIPGDYFNTFYTVIWFQPCTPGILPCPMPCPGVSAYTQIAGHVTWLNGLILAIASKHNAGCAAGFSPE